MISVRAALIIVGVLVATLGRVSAGEGHYCYDPSTRFIYPGSDTSNPCFLGYEISHQAYLAWKIGAPAPPPLATGTPTPTQARAPVGSSSASTRVPESNEVRLAAMKLSLLAALMFILGAAILIRGVRSLPSPTDGDTLSLIERYREQLGRHWYITHLTAGATAIAGGVALFWIIVVFIGFAHGALLSSIFGQSVTAYGVLVCGGVLITFAAAPPVLAGLDVRLLQGIGFSCPSCHTFIQLFGPWRCGRCLRKPSWWQMSFLWRCSSCGHESAWFKCPKCNRTIQLVARADPNSRAVCARYVGDSQLPIWSEQPFSGDIPKVPEGFKRVSEPPLVLAWQRSAADNLIIWWCRVGYGSFVLKGFRYTNTPTSTTEQADRPVMSATGIATGQIDVEVKPGQDGNFGFWLDREGFQPVGFVGFTVPPGAATEAPEKIDPDLQAEAVLDKVEKLLKRQRERLAELEIKRRGEGMTDADYKRQKEAIEDFFEDEVNKMTGPQRR
jgi:hypothetical protein